MPAWAKRVTTNTQDSSTITEIGMPQRQRERDQHVKQHRQFELIAEQSRTGLARAAFRARPGAAVPSSAKVSPTRHENRQQNPLTDIEIPSPD